MAESSLLANQAELIGLSLQLNNVCEILTETSLSVCKGVIQSGCGLVDIVTHPKRSAEQFAHSMTPIITTLGGALALCDNQSPTFVYHPQASTAVAQMQIEMGTELCQLARQEFAQKSGQEKIQAVSKFVTDSILYAKAIKLVGRSVAGLLYKIPEFSIAHEFLDIFAEYNLSVDVSMTTESLQDLTVSLLKSEMKANSIVKTGKLKSKKFVKASASNANSKISLDKKLSALEKAQAHAVKIKKLSDGRVRYYRKERLSKTLGLQEGHHMLLNIILKQERFAVGMNVMTRLEM